MSVVTTAATRPTSVETPVRTKAGLAGILWAMLARDMRVAKRDAVGTLIRIITQPVLFAFVFAFVMPKIGGSGGGGSTPFAGGGAPAFATILVPGLVATAVVFQGLMYVMTPLVMELSYTREIEDRALAPAPTWLLGVEKIIAGAIQAFVAGLVVFPLVIQIHAPGAGPELDFSQWPVALLVLALSAVATAALGLLLGTSVDPRRLSMVIGMVFVPMTMLGCVYYPWQQLSAIPWLQYLVLVNPLLYVCEGLRATLTPVGHMPLPVVITVLTVMSLGLGALGVRAFERKLVS